MTSDQAPVLWPFIAAPGLPPTGAQMGIDVLSGGSFYLDPFGWVLRDDVPVTNPNVICFGKPGRGKSATTKAFILRMMDFGYRTLILGDPKDEYEPLCAALGVEPFRIGPGLPARINPLAFGPLAQGWDHLDAARGPGPGRGRVRAVAHPHPRAGRLPTRRRDPGPVRARGGERRQGRPAAAHRVHPRQHPPGRDHHPRPVAPAQHPHRRPGPRVPVRVHPALPRRDPPAARRPGPARLRGPGRAVRRATPASTSTGPPRSSR